VIVKSSIVTAAPALTAKTLLALLPLTVRLSWPSPAMVTLLVTFSWPLVRLMVWPLRLLSKRIVSPSAAAPRTARSEPGPLSPALVTVRVLGRVRSSRAVSPGTKDRGTGRRQTEPGRSERSKAVNDMVQPRDEQWSDTGSAHRRRRADRARVAMPGGEGALVQAPQMELQQAARSYRKMRRGAQESSRPRSSSRSRASTRDLAT